jgi:hypothetical protein
VKNCALRRVADAQQGDFFSFAMSAKWRAMRYFFVGSRSKA